LKVELSLLVQHSATGPLRWTLEDLRTGARQSFDHSDALLQRLRDCLQEAQPVNATLAPERQARPGTDLNPA
jgi:hypothetical protein